MLYSLFDLKKSHLVDPKHKVNGSYHIFPVLTFQQLFNEEGVPITAEEVLT